MATKLRRTLLIGLGGTGMNSLLHTKKMLYDTYGEIPPMIGFLGIDTDGGVYNKSLDANDGSKISLSTSEQLPITVSNPRQILERTPDAYSWLPRANAGSLDQLNIGAGQVRSNGRFAITVNETNVENRLQSKIAQIKSASIIDNEKYGLLSNDTEVHMVFSLGGGTGCGTFINMAYMVQKLLPGVKISGYAVLADVFRTMMQGPSTVRVRPNAMGALKDIDYLMHLSPVSDPVDFKRLHSVDHINSRPFTALYLIDNKNSNGDVYNDVDQLCEMISLALVTSVGELSVAAASVSDNVAKSISDGAMDLRRKKAWAAGFGVSEIVFNGAKLSEIYCQKARMQLISLMLNGGCDDPSAIANAWFDNNHIRENLGKDDVTDYFMQPAPERTFADIDALDNPKPECLQYLENVAMPRNEDLNAKLDALQERVGTSLDALMKEQINRECGVFLCENILKSILQQIELSDNEMKEETAQFESEIPARESALDTSCRELADCMSTIFKKGKKEFAADVCEATMRLARVRREIKRRRLARDFYNWLRTYVGDTLARIDGIMSALTQVREYSSRAIEWLRQQIGAGSFFQIDLAVSEAEKVTCQASDIVFTDFAKAMEPHGGIIAIAGMSTEQIGKLMKSFVATLPKAKDLASKSVDNMLNSLTDDELNSLCERAIKKALPLFTYNYRGYDAEVQSAPHDSYFIGVADKTRSRLAANNYLKSFVKGGSNMDFASTGVTDRVIIYRQIGVVPAFTVEAIDNYKAEYERFEADREFTSHWDADLCRRMASERFSLDIRDIPSAEKVMETWTVAIIAGIITFSNGKYHIKSRGLGGRPLSGFLVDMGASRKQAYDFFTDNYDVLKPEVESAVSRADVAGPNNELRQALVAAKRAAADGTYLSNISQCPYSAADIEYYADDAELINREIEFILDNEF